MFRLVATPGRRTGIREITRPKRDNGMMPDWAAYGWHGVLTGLGIWGLRMLYGIVHEIKSLKVLHFEKTNGKKIVVETIPHD